MLHWLKQLALIALGIFGAVRLVAQFVPRRSPRPQPGQALPVCSHYPNCVSSQTFSPLHAISPLTFTDTPAAAQTRLRDLVERIPGSSIVHDEPGYLSAVVRSRAFGFPDDLDFLIEPTGVIHMRSAARLGRKDFGVNRQRLEGLRDRWERH